MKHLLSRLTLLVAVALIGSQPATAQSGAFTYQGRVAVDGEDFTGTGRFKFALITSSAVDGQATATATVVNGFLVGYTLTDAGSGYLTVPKVTIIDASGLGATATTVIATNGSVVRIDVTNPGAGYTAKPTVVIDPPGGAESLVTYWSNDGSSTTGSEPLQSVSIPVAQGLFSVVLGDPTALSMQGIDEALFAVRGLRLQIWFDDGVHGFARLNPSQRLSQVPYASHARGVAWANISDVPGNFTNAIYAAGTGLSVSNNTVAITTNGVTAALLATNAVTSFAIANGTLAAEDLGPTVLNDSFWSLTGNTKVADTNSPASTNSFIGTLDNRPLIFQVNGQRVLRLEPGNGGAPNVIGGSAVNGVGTNRVGVVIAGGGSAAHAWTNWTEANYATIGGGIQNSVSTNSDGSTISGGGFNSVGTNAANATIAGGQGNAIGDGASWATIGGGKGSKIGTNSSYASIAGGWENTVLNSSGHSTISGGRENLVLSNSPFAVISGGVHNTNGASYATVPGGTLNAALGPNSFAAGRRAIAKHGSSFVWGDGYNADIASTLTNQVTFRATGGFRIFTDGSLSAGATLPTGQSAWTVVSDAALKKNRVTVDGREILAKLAAMPIDRWNYLWEDDSNPPHLGPMAQDFKHAFYPGTDDTSISTLDFDGVALAAIQGLNRKLEDKDAEVAALRRELEELRHLIRQALPAVSTPPQPTD